MAKKYNIRLIKKRESYSGKAVCKLLLIHPRTIHSWIKEGLKTISNKPILIMGFDLAEFLSKKIQKRKYPLKANQFFCAKCRKQVLSKQNKVTLKCSDKTIGKQGFKEIIIQGFCEVCNSRLNRFSHTGKLEEINQVFSLKGASNVA